MNHHDGIEPYKFSLSLRDDVIEIVLLYRRQDGGIYCVTELVGLLLAPSDTAPRVEDRQTRTTTLTSTDRSDQLSEWLEKAYPVTGIEW